VSQPNPSEYFKIVVVDAATDRGVPLVELKTTNAIAVYTDSNGIVAWNEPGLMDRDVYFFIRSHGYVFPSPGRTLRVTRGGSVVLKMERVNVAERLYRITGQGIYRDSLLTGTPVPLRNPLLNAEVVGQDSVFATPYRGRLFWLWDDTSRAAGPLGSLAGCAATSEWPGNGGLDPGVGIDLNYFLDDSGFCKQITPFPVPGMKWKYWATTVTDEQGRERLLAKYESMKDLGDASEIGLAVFDDEKQVFERVATFGRDARSNVPIHPFRASDRGVQSLYFPGPLPDLRARAEFKALIDPASYEGFSCLSAGSRYANERSSLDRRPDGKLVCAWKRNTPTLTYDQEKELVQAGKMAPDEGLHQLRDILTGVAIKPHAGSVCWNDITHVALDDDKAAFEVVIDGESYQVSLSRGEVRLTGRWRKSHDEGTLDCGSLGAPDWTRSPDVVPLYGYRRADGSVYYSTDAASKDSGLSRSAAPVGRVWRNPMRVLVVDPSAAVR
jgi:hypothetical protein